MKCRPENPTLLELAVVVDAIPDVQTKEQLLGLIQRCVKAERLLRRIASVRLPFSLDPGGPQTQLEALHVIEGWIRDNFDGSYYGDILITINESDR